MRYSLPAMHDAHSLCVTSLNLCLANSPWCLVGEVLLQDHRQSATADTYCTAHAGFSTAVHTRALQDCKVWVKCNKVCNCLQDMAGLQAGVPLRSFSRMDPEQEFRLDASESQSICKRADTSGKQCVAQYSSAHPMLLSRIRPGIPVNVYAGTCLDELHVCTTFWQSML